MIRVGGEKEAGKAGQECESAQGQIERDGATLIGDGK
jgi:hypothetical protein